MSNGNNNLNGSSGLRDISQMSMGGAQPAGQSSRNNRPDLQKYMKPALFAAAGILAVALVFFAVKALSGGKYSQKDYEEAAMYMMALPLSEKELEQWKARLEDCYPPEAEKVLKEIYSSMEDLAEGMEFIKDEDEEMYEWIKEMMKSYRVSDSRMLDEKEYKECEQLIEKNYGISIEIDGGCLVEVDLDPKVVKKLGENLEDTDKNGVILVLRSDKYIGPWASADGLRLDEVKNLRRDLDWR